MKSNFKNVMMNFQQTNKIKFLHYAFEGMLFISMSLFLASCGTDNSYDLPNDDGPNAENPINKEELEVILLKKEVFKELYEPFLHYQYTYQYDDKNRVSSFTLEMFDENGIIDPEKTWGRKMEYLDDRIITDMYINTGELTFSRHQIKIDDGLIRKEIYYKGELGETEIKKYENNDCGLTANEIFANDVRVYSYTYEYTDENCSSIEKYYDFEGELGGTKEVIRDNNYKYNPWSNSIINPNKSWTSNVIEVNHYDKDQILIDYASYSSTFILNAKNYPISETRTHGNGEVLKRTYEYYD